MADQPVEVLPYDPAWPDKFANADDIVRLLEAQGWLFWPEDPGRHYRLWFLRPRPEDRTHHLHVLEHHSSHAQALIAFRDALRSDRALRVEYAELKQALAEQHMNNRNAYTNAKTDFVELSLRRAGVEPPRRTPLPE